MTMMISKFHKLIRSKILWIVILVIVAVGMVFYGVAPPSAGPARTPTSPGTLHGEEVPPETFQRARLNTYVGITLMLGRAINLTPEVDRQLDTAAWNRLVTLDQARRMGITATDEEVAGAIRTTELFHTDGRFDPRNYDAFAQQFLRGLGMSKRGFEEHVREEIIVQKLRSVIDRSFLISPLEVRRTYHSLSDELTIEYGLLTPDLVRNAVAVTEKEARAYFNEDPDRFRQPERLTLRVATFDPEALKDDVEVTDEEIQEYYDFNLDQFEVVAEAEDDEPTDFVDVEDEATDPDDPFSFDDDLTGTVTEYQPLDEVRDEIAATLREQSAVALAEDRANRFVGNVGRRPERVKQEAFMALADEEGIPVVELPPLAPSDELPEPYAEAGLAFRQAAVNLTEQGDYSYSDPVVGSNAVYVLSLVERIPEHTPSFEDVADQVMAVAEERAVMDRLDELAEAIRVEARKLIEEGDSIADLLASYGVVVETPEPFSAATAEFDTPYAESLLRGVLVRNQGEVTEPIPVEGGLLLAHVIERIPADTATLGEVRPQIITTMRRQNGGTVFEAYQDYLMATYVVRNDVREEPPAAGDADEADAANTGA